MTHEIHKGGQNIAQLGFFIFVKLYLDFKEKIDFGKQIQQDFTVYWAGLHSIQLFWIPGLPHGAGP